MRTRLTCAALIAATLPAVLPTAPLAAQPSPDHATHAPPMSSEPVTIKSGSTTYAGFVETPAGNGQHGAVVIVAANDAHSADAAKALAKTLAAHGLVAMTYDASEVNVDNAHAALAVLRLRGDVNKDGVGVIGLGSGAPVVQQLAHDDAVHYAVAIRAMNDGSAKDANLADYKIDKKVLLVQAVADPFSDATERYCQSAQKKVPNLTLWATSSDDIDGMNANTSLLGRISDWAAARAN